MTGMVSNVFRNNGIIKKVYLSKEEYPERHIPKHWDQEIKALKLLKGYKHFPQLIDILEGKREIIMTDCGVPLAKNNLPQNWKRQCGRIEKTLNEKGIHHIDFWGFVNNVKTHKNILVKDGIINVIDFGLLANEKREYDTITDVVRTIAHNR